MYYTNSIQTVRKYMAQNIGRAREIDIWADSRGLSLENTWREESDYLKSISPHTKISLYCVQSLNVKLPHPGLSYLNAVLFWLRLVPIGLEDHVYRYVFVHSRIAIFLIVCAYACVVYFHVCVGCVVWQWLLSWWRTWDHVMGPTSVCRRCFCICSWQMALLYSSSWVWSSGTLLWVSSLSWSYTPPGQTHTFV